MYLVSSYLIVFISLFSSFINVNVGGLTSNPILLLTSLLITLNKIKFHLINRKIIPLLIINLLSTIFVYFNDGKGFDFFFVFLYLCIIYLLISLENFAIKLASINENKFKSIINQISNFFIAFSFLIFSLNSLNLHCILFKCRLFGPYGFSLSNSEPSYVGLFTLLYISFAFLSKGFISNIKFLIIILSGILSAVLSRSIMTISSLLIITFFSMMPIIISEIILFFKKFRFNKLLLKFIFFILFLISIQFFLGYTEKLIGELNMAYASLFEISNLFDLESYKIIFFLSGNRLFYLLASLNSSIINLVFGHGFLSSSAIYTSKILDVTDNLGFSTASLFARSFIMGAKPHSSFGFIIFTNGFLGLFILFKNEIKLLLNAIINFNLKQISLFNKNKLTYFINNWFLVLPFVLLIYPSTNTDTFKYGSFLIHFTYFYKNRFQK